MMPVSALMPVIVTGLVMVVIAVPVNGRRVIIVVTIVVAVGIRLRIAARSVAAIPAAITAVAGNHVRVAMRPILRVNVRTVPRLSGIDHETKAATRGDGETGELLHLTVSIP